MNRRNIDRDWHFDPDRARPTTFMGVGGQRVVSLPHDFMLESEMSPGAKDGAASGFYSGGIGTYTKFLDIPAELCGQRVCIESDGAYMNAEIWLNGEFACAHHYGYTPFVADITEYVRFGERNRLMIAVNNGLPYTSRWYTGSGLYRHVYMLMAPKVHLSPWPIYAYTERVEAGSQAGGKLADYAGGNAAACANGDAAGHAGGGASGKTACVMVEATAENHTDRAFSGHVRITLSAEGAGGAAAAEGVAAIYLPPMSKRAARCRIVVENARIWDVDSPELYTVRASLYGPTAAAAAPHGPAGQPGPSEAGQNGAPGPNEACLDEDETLFGIRTVSVDAKNGFMLNGRTLKIKGGCAHHTNGILGAMSFYGSEFRKARLHKEAGFNAIRCAHNPPSRDMLEACDRLGVMVLDEAFDMWRMSGNPNDYHSYFDACWKADVEAFMLRDRSHPCVVMWSTGNEIQERNGLSRGYGLAWEIADFMRGLDPTRPVTNAICEPFNGLRDGDMRRLHENGAARYAELGQAIWGAATEPFAAPLDVVGYNYLDMRYEPDGAAYPNRVMLGTESFPKDFAAVWDRVERLPHVIGDFAWTSYDYLGEAGLGAARYFDPQAPAEDRDMSAKYPWRAAFCGDFDLCGHARPQLRFRQIVWGSDETHIAVLSPDLFGKDEALSRWGFRGAHPFWDYPAHRGKPVKIDVYSRAPTVELLLNGRSLGRRGAGKAAGYVAPFEALYEDGELTAISLDGSGAEISRHTLSTPGKFASLAVEMGEPVGDIIYADISAVDAAGRLVPFDDKRVRATVGGCGELIAFGSGRPATDEGFTSGVATTYLGRAQAVIRVNRGSDGGGADGGAGNMGGADGANGANGAGSAGVAVAGGGAGNAGNAGRPTLTVEIA